MAKNTEARPEWFKFWRRNRRQLDIEQLDMKSRGIIFTNMMRYFDGDDSELLEMTPLECMAFNVLKINVDDTFSEYAITSAQNRANANKRWQRSNADEYDRMRAHANHAEDRRQKSEDRSQKTEDRSGERTADKPPRATRFIPPTVEEVTAYCQERKNCVDAQRFVDFYASKGWKVGKENMRDWKAAVRTWEHRDKGADISSPDRYSYSAEESL